MEMNGIALDIRLQLKGFALSVSFATDCKRIGILGASGSGKSMTLKSIAGIVTPDEGRIALGERVLFDKEKKINVRTQERKVGYLFQNYALFPSMTVEQNVCAGLKGQSAGEKEKVRALMHTFQLEGLEHRLPAELSGGQQQRVALARILAYEPDVILLDEPFSALDVYLKDHMQLELQERLRDYDGTILMVSHDRDEIYRFSEELLILDAGKNVTYGKTRDVFAHPKTKAAAQLTGCKNFSRAERIDDHHFKALDYGITMETAAVLPETFHHIGYRAHDFVPVWGERQKNCLTFRLASRVDGQFEDTFYLLPETADAGLEDAITWFVQRETAGEIAKKGFPDFLQFKEESLMFLL